MRHSHNDQPIAALLMFGDTEHSAALRHEVPLAIIDSLMLCERAGRRYVLAKNIERSRIERVLPDAEVLDFFDFGMKQLSESGLLPEEAAREVAVRVARHIDLSEAIIPGDFPVALADGLREEGICLKIDDRAFQLRRRRKTGAELDGIARQIGRPRRARARPRRSWLARGPETAAAHISARPSCLPSRCEKPHARRAPPPAPPPRPR